MGVELRIAGRRLDECLVPALAHHATDRSPAGAADFVVHVWDGAAGVPLPSAWPVPDAHERDRERTPFRSAWQPAERSLSVLADQCEGFHWVPDAEAIPYYDRAAPLRVILHWLLAERGVQQVHSAAVGTTDGAALIVGRGGSGKSTSALAAMLAGLRFVGDDYVAVEAGAPPMVHSLYNSAKLDGDHVRRIPEIAAALENPSRLADEKAVVLVQRHWPERVATSMPLRMILVPSIGGQETRLQPQETRLQPIATGEAMRALAPSTIIQLPGAHAGAMARMAVLVRSLPAYRLMLGSHISGIGPAIAEALAQAPTAASGE